MIYRVKSIIQNVISSIKNEPTNKIRLGRWKMETIEKTELKLFYANEDHCGSCQEKQDMDNSSKEKEEEYYRFFLV